MTLKVGDQVRDTYTGRVGKVLDLDELNNRARVAFDYYTMVGCQSWFVPIDDDA